MDAATNPGVRVVRVGRRIVIPRQEIEAKLGGQSLVAKWADHSTFTIEEFREIFGLSRSAAYQAVKGNG
jgi:hypothetical protein